MVRIGNDCARNLNCTHNEDLDAPLDLSVARCYIESREVVLLVNQRRWEGWVTECNNQSAREVSNGREDFVGYRVRSSDHGDSVWFGSCAMRRHHSSTAGLEQGTLHVLGNVCLQPSASTSKP